MTNLYEINNEINKVLGSATVDEDTGEVFINIELLEALNIDKDEMMGNLIGAYKNLLSDAEQLKKEADKFVYKSNVMKNRAESLKRYLIGNLSVGEKRTFGFHNVGWRKSQSLTIDDDVIVSDFPEYTTEKTTIAFDKTKLSNAIKGGEEFKGIYIVKKQSIQIK